MNDKTSISHDEVMARKLRERPKFAAEYLMAAIEDADEPELLRIALGHLAKSRTKAPECSFRNDN